MIVILYKHVVIVLAFNFQKNWHPVPNYFYIKYQLFEPLLHQDQVVKSKKLQRKQDPLGSDFSMLISSHKNTGNTETSSVLPLRNTARALIALSGLTWSTPTHTLCPWAYLSPAWGSCLLLEPCCRFVCLQLFLLDGPHSDTAAVTSAPSFIASRHAPWMAAEPCSLLCPTWACRWALLPAPTSACCVQVLRSVPWSVRGWVSPCSWLTSLSSSLSSASTAKVNIKPWGHPDGGKPHGTRSWARLHFERLVVWVFFFSH